MEKKEILLPSKRYFKAEEQDLNLNVKLENDETLLRQGDKDIVVNLSELFDSERNKSINYKIYGKIKMVFKNMYSGYTNYTPLLRNLYLVGDGTGSDIGFVPYNEFAFLRNDVIREKTISATGSTLGGISVIPTIELTGDTGHTTTTSIDAPYKNWNLYLSYVYSGDTTHPMKYTLSNNTVFSFTAGDGIPFRVTTGDTYVTLTSPVEHGLSSGEHLILSATTLTTHFWVSGITYSKDNIIHYSNKIYTSKSNSNLNNEPPTTGSTYWKLVTNWSSTETYDINNLVFYSGKTYKSLTNSNLNNTPPITGTTSSWERTSNRQYYTLPITSDTEKYRIFNIDNVGNGVYNSEKYVINILRSEFSSGTTLNSVVFGRRCTNINNISGTTSTYYVHKHKIITSKDDYIMDKVGFESSLFEDERKILFENTLGENDVLVERNRQESVLFDFKKTFALSGITNNLGYTPTEVYVSIILKNENGFFDYPPKVGYKFNFHDTWMDQHFSGVTKTTYPYEFNITTGTTFNGKTGTTLGVTYDYTNVTFTGGTTIPVGTSGLTGAFVEYNKKEMNERIISEAYHRFSHRPFISGGTQLFNHGQDGNILDSDGNVIFSEATSTNLLGYYYQPYHRVKLRQLSPYIETSKIKNKEDFFNLPENIIYDSEEDLWKWRDVYDHGFVDQDGNGTTFPFMNNIHYVVNDINFYLRNEQTYFNKADGMNGYNNYKNKTNC
jgi:hypothetical protein